MKNLLVIHEGKEQVVKKKRMVMLMWPELSIKMSMIFRCVTLISVCVVCTGDTANHVKPSIKV